MRESFLAGEIARATRNSLVAHGILVGLITWLVIETHVWIADRWREPSEVSPAALAAATGPGDLKHTRITVTPERLFPLGQIVERSEDGHETVQADLAGALMAGHVLAVRLPARRGPPDGGVVGTPLTGNLAPLSDEARDVFPDDFPARQIIPLMLDTTAELWGDWLYLLVVAAAAMWSLWRLKLAVERRADPARHPASRRLAAYGDVTQQSHALDAGLLQTRGGRKVLGATLAPGFLVHRRWFDTMILPTSGILWIYKRVTWRWIHVIPIGRAYHAVLRGAHGELVELKAAEKEVDRALPQLAEAVPGAITGYDAKIASTLRTAAGRRELEAIVRNRREGARR